MNEFDTRDLIVEMARSMFERRLTFGSSGNISVKIDGGWLMTPTGSSLGRLDPLRLSKLDEKGTLISGDAPTKESFLHLAMYRERAGAGAVVHLHSTHSVAVSCLDGINHDDVLPPITAYYVMRVGKLPLIPYYAPGDKALVKRSDGMRQNTRRCFWPIMGRWFRVHRYPLPLMPLKNLRKPLGFTCCFMAVNALLDTRAGGRPEEKVSIGSEYSRDNTEYIGGRRHRPGILGLGIAQSMVKREIKVVGFDINSAAVEKLVEAGGAVRQA